MLQDDSQAGDLPVPDPTPKRPNRKAWKEKVASGRNRTGTPIPPPATKKDARAFVKELAKEAIVAVVDDKKPTAEQAEKYAKMSSVVRAHIFSYLGEDIEAARTEFARELFANARKVSQHIMGEFESYPPQVKAFLMTAFFDKAEAANNKLGGTARGAAVAIQINQFGPDGRVNREEIMRQLSGEAFGLKPEPIPVQAPKAE